MARILIALIAIGFLCGPVQAQPKRDPAGAGPKKNTPEFLAAFKPVLERAAKSTVRILSQNDEIALGIVVTGEGHILTKLSELKPGLLTVKTSDGRTLYGTMTASDEIYDVAIVKVPGEKLTPVEWSISTSSAAGDWTASTSPTGDPIAVGVVSVSARTLAPPYGAPLVPSENSGYLGVSLSVEGVGALIESVSPGSPAEKAGVKAKDIILAIDSHKIANQESLMSTLMGYKSGDAVKLSIERGKDKIELNAVLGRRTPETGFRGRKGRTDTTAMGSILSQRRSGIPSILQHDQVLKPSDCGGPIVDLDGKVIGMNICRAGRVESHAIPSETILQLLPTLLTAKADATPEEKVREAQLALDRAKLTLTIAEKNLAASKQRLEKAIADEKWWKDRPVEVGPAPRTVTK